MDDGNTLVFFDMDGHGHAIRFDTPEQREKVMLQIAKNATDAQKEQIRNFVADSDWDEITELFCSQLELPGFQRNQFYIVDVADDVANHIWLGY